MTAIDRAERDFDVFARSVGERVRRGLVAVYGVEIGTDVAADAMRYAWERWTEISLMTNPAGYLFRVGQSHARPHVRWARRRQSYPSSYERTISGGGDVAELVDLLAALGRLPAHERAAVVLVRAHGYPYRDAAELLGVTTTALTNHVHRGMRRLRLLLEVPE